MNSALRPLLEVLGRAKAAGIREVSTDNHSKNAAILAVNERLGYEPQPGVIEFMGTLAPRSLTTRRHGASDISNRR